MKLIALLLFIMIVLTVINGLVFMKKLIKLQKENNNLLKEIANNKNNEAKDDNAKVNEDITKFISVVDNDTDRNGDTLKIVSATKPEHGTVKILDGAGGFLRSIKNFKYF